MANAYEEKTIDLQSPADRLTVPKPRGESDAMDEWALDLEPTIVLGRE
ncbi:hypothetical protein P3102_16900 [Amycolatopsis sp. QT-25]|nr:hypothetical protein [Amycolatopsis sp. QT-25]WET82765.1 hypothetical protein P3102_16900 [Amycolatopsis sp. QT-25]